MRSEAERRGHVVAREGGAKYPGPVLGLEGISKRYVRGGRELSVLDGVSLELSRGEITGVFGASRSGKTTLLRIACGLERPDAGSVLVGGERLDRLSRAEHLELLRRRVGCVWGAEFWPVGLSVLEQVALPLLLDGCERRRALRRARELMELFGAGRCEHVGLREVSDGERQRLALARALVSDPVLLLADSALANLSLLEQEQIMLRLVSLARERGLAVLVTDTGAGAVVGADSIFYLRGGQLIGADPGHRLGEVIELPSAREHA